MKASVGQCSVVHGVAACLLVSSLIGLPGCRRQKKERKNRTIEGTALSIDEATCRVAMNWYNKKKQMEMKIEGIVTPQTEILINGRIAKLGEVKVGEQILVIGYVEGKKMVATRIEIERDEWGGGPGSATKPATKPAEKTGAKAATKPASKPAADK